MRIYLDTYIVKKISHFTNKLSTFVLMVARLTIVALKFFSYEKLIATYIYSEIAVEKAVINVSKVSDLSREGEISTKINQ